MSQRIVIGGGPKTGKTMLADKMALPSSVPARHTDDLIGQLDWSAASQEVAGWFDAPGPWIVEGVATFRALRKWLEQHPDGKPCDLVIVLTVPHEVLLKGQLTMAKGCATVWAEIAPLLAARQMSVILNDLSGAPSAPGEPDTPSRPD